MIVLFHLVELGVEVSICVSTYLAGFGCHVYKHYRDLWLLLAPSGNSLMSSSQNQQETTQDSLGRLLGVLVRDLE